MRNRKLLSKTGEQIAMKCRHLIREYGRVFGPKMRLITWALAIMASLLEWSRSGLRAGVSP